MNDKCHENCVGKQEAVRLIKQGKLDLLNKLNKAIEPLILLTDFGQYNEIIDELRESLEH